jgi:hypothetical protein
MEQQETKMMSQRWTREILERCTPRELLVIVAEYGVKEVAQRMGYSDIVRFVQEKMQ